MHVRPTVGPIVELIGWIVWTPHYKQISGLGYENTPPWSKLRVLIRSDELEMATTEHAQIYV